MFSRRKFYEAKTMGCASSVGSPVSEATARGSSKAHSEHEEWISDDSDTECFVQPLFGDSDTYWADCSADVAGQPTLLPSACTAAVADLAPLADTDAKNAQRWSVSEIKFRLAKHVALTKFGTDDTGLIFLLVKGVAPHRSRGDSDAYFEQLLQLDDFQAKEWRLQLDRVVSSEADTTFDQKPEDWQHFTAFLNASQESQKWAADGVFVFHLVHNLCPPQRHQASDGCCFMHAVIVLQHYLVAVLQSDVGMIDMAKLIQQCFSSDDLERHIFYNEGGSSNDLLKSVLVPGSSLQVASPMRFEEYLKTYGPALVANFSVREDFHRAQGRVSFDGKPQSRFVGYHSMVLIGARVDAEPDLVGRMCGVL